MTDNVCLRILSGLVFFNCVNGPNAEGADKVTGAAHQQPAGGIFGDPIPFCHDGVRHVFCLRNGSWYHLVSRNLVNWEDLGPAIVADENDLSTATGSIVEKDGLFHAFHTTASRKDRGPGLPSVRVATSRDPTKWTKEPGPPLLLKRDVPAGRTQGAAVGGGADALVAQPVPPDTREVGEAARKLHRDAAPRVGYHHLASDRPTGIGSRYNYPLRLAGPKDMRDFRLSMLVGLRPVTRFVGPRFVEIAFSSRFRHRVLTFGVDDRGVLWAGARRSPRVGPLASPRRWPERIHIVLQRKGGRADFFVNDVHIGTRFLKTEAKPFFWVRFSNCEGVAEEIALETPGTGPKQKAPRAEDRGGHPRSRLGPETGPAGQE